MIVATNWNAREYQRIASAAYQRGNLVVRFEDGAQVTIDAERVLPPGTREPWWEAMTTNPYEIVVPTPDGEIEVPWSTIRVLTDREYSTYLANVAEDEARQIGLRLRELRTSRNLTSKELAERSGIAPQSLSRIELGRHDVVLTTLQRILAAMGYTLSDLVAPSPAPASVSGVLKRLASVGIDHDLVFDRLLPGASRHQRWEQTSDADDQALIEQIARAVSQVFNWSVSSILGHGELLFQPEKMPALRLKAPAGVNPTRATAYAYYAHYIATLVLQATLGAESRPLPGEPDELREVVISEHGSLDFENLLKFCWDCGVPVVPLRDPGAFHGACWKIDDRYVIVLKQLTDFQSRWQVDLLHEMKHVASHLSEQRPGVIETGEIIPLSDTYRDSDEEWEASEFASDVLLNGRAEEMAQECVRRAQGKVERLKLSVQRVAAIEHVPVDALANYVAYRVQSSGINWWGAANNLQVTEPLSWLTAQRLLLERISLDRLNSPERDLLLRALSEPMEV